MTPTPPPPVPGRNGSAVLPCARGTMWRCPDCRRTFDRSWNPRTGRVLLSTGRYQGAIYCRACSNRRCKAHRTATSRKVWATCHGCGTTFRPKNGTVYNRATYNARHWYCSKPCHTSSTRISKDGLCVAPCKPRCPFPHKNQGLCQGHDKRQQRGRPIDTPLNMKHSAAVRASPFGQAWRDRLRMATRLPTPERAGARSGG